MKYEFPVLTHGQQILDAIKDNKSFIVADRGFYTVVNYFIAGDPEKVFPDVSTEQDAILRECRGITFRNDTGEIIARKFHKFFNLGERADSRPENIDWNRPQYITEKLDGSMITPCYVDGTLEFHTKMGATDVAKQVFGFLADHPWYETFAKFMIDSFGATPIFEWCTPQQRIVVDHAEERLVLLACRNMVTGQYMSREDLEWWTRKDGGFNIDLVRTVTPGDDINSFVETVRTWEGAEGVVVTFEDGMRYKVKSDWYVQLHRTKDKIRNERYVVNLIVNGMLDDLKPVLDPKDLEKIIKYEAEFGECMSAWISKTIELLQDIKATNMSRKDFALGPAQDIPKKLQSIVFSCFDLLPEQVEVKVKEGLFQMLSKNCGSNRAFDEAKKELFADIVYRGLWDKVDEQ